VKQYTGENAKSVGGIFQTKLMAGILTPHR